MKNTEAVTSLDLPLERVSSGKVREIYALDRERLVFIATDRISAYDVIMEQGIPNKGAVLTKMTLFWLELAKDICPNHLITAAPDEIARDLPEAADVLADRTMIVRRLNMLPVEFVIRGYLAGSGWKEYQQSGTVCGIKLDKGLQESSKLPEPIFTPATKAETGHDLNISEDEAAELCGPDILKTAKQYALDVYVRGAEYAAEKGIILADTKFEFGMLDGQVVLADEVLTPDSSRFWPADSYEPGRSQPSYDKQYLRDWLDETGWDHEPPPPQLPEDVIAQTSAKYIEAYEKITGRSFTDDG